MTSDNSTFVTGRQRARTPRGPSLVHALCILWSRPQPERVGEVLLADGEGFVFGRTLEHGAPGFVRQRPGSNHETGPLDSRGLSRQQWRITPQRDGLLIENIGRRSLRHNGAVTPSVLAVPGDLLEISGELLLLVVTRPFELAPERLPPALVPRFGEVDGFGIVGESAAAWELRRQLAFAAGRDEHVLLTGASGCGKELAAAAIHALSRRSGARLVARNAATLPDGLIDAELFGNPRDYPNPGMPERPGLIGAADGSTLFLDEIGEMSHALQAHLLRVVDTGEYQRLGEARQRTADVRVVAATNRDPMALKHDFLARLRLRIRIPALERRREDIPLIARHLLRTLAASDPVVAERAFDGSDPTCAPAWTLRFVAELVTAAYATNVRELERRLWEAIGERAGTGLGADDLDESADARPTDEPWSESGPVDPQHVTAAQVIAALDASDGNRDRAWRVLGLRSRHQLFRLMRKLGVKPSGPPTFGQETS